MRTLLRISSCCFIFFALMLQLQAQTSPDSLRWKGKAFAEIRSFYLATLNKGELKDFQALALGGKLGYWQPLGKHFSLSWVGYLSVNMQLQDLTEPDLITGKGSRYESGLFNITDPGQAVVFLPGEIFAEYKHHSHAFRLGRMKVNSPFVNPQDGRMIPTLVEGAWYAHRRQNRHLYQLGLITRVAPRSTDRFYGIGESIGTYPAGRGSNGRPSGYPGHTRSDFLVLANVDYSVSDELKISFWEYYAENLFNLLYLKPSIRFSENGPTLAMEFAQQNRLGEGGNRIDSLRYMVSQQAQLVGAELQWGKPVTRFSIGYNHIFGSGRWVFPREWGREFLFTFQKRERSEGLGSSDALLASLSLERQLGKQGMKAVVGLGQHWTSPVNQAIDNKYALGSYSQLNVDLFYRAKAKKGLKPEFLFVYKRASGTLPENPALYLNKVDLLQFNLIVSYIF